MPSNVGSLEITGEWFLQTNASSLLTSLSSYTISWFAKFNSVNAVYSNLIATTFDPIFFIGSGGAVNINVWGTTSDPTQVGYAYAPGVVYHIAIVWTKSGTWNVYINGISQGSGASAATSPWTTTQLLAFGSQGASPGNIQMSNLAIWANYAGTATDIINLRDATYTPATLIGSVSLAAQPATTWFTYGDAASGALATSDNSFVDQIGTQTLPNFGGTLSNAAYAAPLVYVPPCLVSLYISKCGKTAYAMAQSNAISSALITGTVSVNSGSNSLTTSARQLSWNGQGLQIAGDSSATTYNIRSGRSQNYEIYPVYGGSSNAVAAAATLVTSYPVSAITAIASSPTFSVQWGGTGSVYAVNSYGPVWSDSWASTLVQNPFACWQLLCGPVESILVQTPGSGYSTSPTVAATGGGSGSGLVLGTPVVSGGVVSYAVTNGGSGYETPSHNTDGTWHVSLPDRGRRAVVDLDHGYAFSRVDIGDGDQQHDRSCPRNDGLRQRPDPQCDRVDRQQHRHHAQPGGDRKRFTRADGPGQTATGHGHDG